MVRNAVHFGHKKTRQHPKMSAYIFGVRNTVSIIDLEKTQEKLRVALEFLKKTKDDGKVILFVDTVPSTAGETRKIAEEIGMPYVAERWSGGTITNWKTITTRIEHLKDLEMSRSSEDWEKYTKKERKNIGDEIIKLNKSWGGIKNMNNLPDVVFVVNMKEDELAVKEARMRNIKVVAIADTNVDPELADYPIPANDDALSSVKYILNRVKEALLK
ncbi:MAG: 30S ribosomal protein S2 [Candidatus Spechtbacteria bacterium RIFCSPHIGHO2_02_FULL_43_15b]|uniref:Small ribosomal subunit protein uS2 n=1 Tax=Candidatus Spechtbacteria bacterium RIFCSPHIGHO2_01_FULL_43_30 TaxID=1802158 RepID=A0A1G2H6G2_9BACT|nr:MAG: 30S ribosomal protein S2 [Candidatus Spechtbacteria bacterium RIFCSPHIGHO2_01_FULL_43_30]OGZ59488.1 MAG: 30S ribosomal protein S2 [Candidatus Spechtbacteria bacterium RIFCSPHIGHO2_02_FULL_43_15b]